jgi:8-oxo-dGTP pyrophosphatase MutT (NUDIX family)
MKVDLVTCGFLIHSNKVLLIHHKKLNKWIPPGGHIEENETPDEALKRELKEELGLDVEILNRNDIPIGGDMVEQLAAQFYVNVHNVGDHNHCCFYYLCEPKDPKNHKNLEQLTINKSELKDLGWFSAEELGQKKIPDNIRNIALKAFELFDKLKR